MKTLTYDTPEDRATDFLYQRVGNLKLVKDKAGKSVRYERQHPSIELLMDICKKEKIKLPKNHEIKDLLLALVRGGYDGRSSTSTQPPAASMGGNDKAWDQDVKDEEQAIKAAEQAIRSAEQAKRSAEQAKLDLEQSEEAEIEAEIKVEEEKEAEQAQREADKKATLNKK